MFTLKMILGKFCSIDRWFTKWRNT